MQFRQQASAAEDVNVGRDLGIEVKLRGHRFCGWVLVEAMISQGQSAPTKTKAVVQS
jgi:hypothetical protein